MARHRFPAWGWAVLGLAGGLAVLGVPLAAWVGWNWNQANGKLAVSSAPPAVTPIPPAAPQTDIRPPDPQPFALKLFRVDSPPTRIGVVLVRVLACGGNADHSYFAVEFRAAERTAKFDYLGALALDAQMTDEFGNRYPRRSDALAREAAGQTAVRLGIQGDEGAGPVYNDRPRWDAVVFDRPVTGAKQLRLHLQLTNGDPTQFAWP